MGSILTCHGIFVLRIGRENVEKRLQEQKRRLAQWTVSMHVDRAVTVAEQTFNGNNDGLFYVTTVVCVQGETKKAMA